MHKWTTSDSDLISMYVNGKTYSEIIKDTGTNNAYLAKLTRGIQRIRKPTIIRKKKDFLIKNGRPIVYAPEHDRAFKSGTLTGYCYQHILVAEEKLGRKLQNGEVVHHLDENKQNNNPNNLVVFVNNAEHSRYHKCKDNGNLICDNNGVAKFIKNNKS